MQKKTKKKQEREKKVKGTYEIKGPPTSDNEKKNEKCGGNLYSFV